MLALFVDALEKNQLKNWQENQFGICKQFQGARPVKAPIARKFHWASECSERAPTDAGIASTLGKI